MQKILLTHDFSFPLSIILKVREMRYHRPDIWTSFGQTEIEEEKTYPDHRYIRRRITIKNKLPAIARKIFQSFTIQAIEEMRIYDSGDKFNAITTLDLPGNLVYFNEISSYFISSSGNCRRTVELTTEIKVPVAGLVIEKILISEFSKESNDDRNKIDNLAKELVESLTEAEL